ncbi:hypothetical protein ACFV3R_07255 [Streptomyces sp. NPDC059740]|uniref:hypothetical protein n=1 Tax=Streptomyces sp. NPDC059740 TaxID=3346926 RepID=UPI00364BBA5B
MSAPAPDPLSGAGPEVVVHGDNHGVVSTGPHSVNLVFTSQGPQQVDNLRELPLHEAPLLPTAPALRLFGRDELVAEVAARVAAGGHAQLYGRAGVGRSAVAEAVHHRLAAQGRRGHVLRQQESEPGTLDSVYRRLATAFFGRTFLRVDEADLRAAVAGVRDVHVTLLDTALDRADLNRLTETFAGCTFLFTSPHLTLPDTAGAHHVQPLGRHAAVALLSAELGLDPGPVGLRNLQFDHAYRESGGRPQRLRQYAEFIKGMDQWRARVTREPHDQPPPVDPAGLSPERQAQTLALALGEPARRVLVALATFGVPVTAHWFAPVTGCPADAAAGPELLDRRLVTLEGEAYRITQDAAQAVRGLEWPAAPAVTAAEGVMAAVAAAEVDPPVDPGLLTALTRALNADREWAVASHFVRTVLPVALAAGALRTVAELYALGRTAALRGGLRREHAHYLRAEEQTRKLLEGDRTVVAAALVLLASPVAPAAIASGGKVSAVVGKFVSAVTTKAGMTVAAVSVAAAATAGVVVAVTSDSTPAGCEQALSANQALSTGKPRTYPELATTYRQMATGMDEAAGAADEDKVRSVLRAQAADFRQQAEEVAGKSAGGSTGRPLHPDVVAAMVGGEKLSSGIHNLQAVSAVCPLD